jgi:4-amino-4-deoxy-L-arabinose transferase-like glycosyltransferase
MRNLDFSLKKFEIVAVCLVLAAGLALRLWSAWSYWHWYDEKFPGAWERSESVFSQDGSLYVHYARSAESSDSTKSSWQKKAYYRPPLASYYFSALLHLCRFDRFRVSAAQAMLSIGAYFALYLISRCLFSRAISIAALCVLMVHPVCIFYDISFEDSTLALFFLAWTLFAFVRTAGPSYVKWAPAGLLMGLTLCCRPNLIFVFLFLCAAVIMRFKKRCVPVLLSFVVPMIMVILPPILHNYRASGRFSFIVDTAGENLFWGNNEHHYYLISMQGFCGIPQVDQGSPERLLKTMLAGEYGVKNGEQMYKKAFARYAADHPWRFVRGLALKACRHVSNYEIPRNDNFYFLRQGALPFHLPLLPYSLLFAFMAIGIAAARPFRPALFALLSVWAGVFITEVVFFNAGRYRAMAVPFIAPVAVAGAFAYVNFIRSRRWRPVLLGGFCAAVLFIVGHVCLSSHEKQQHLAVSHYKAALEELFPERNHSLGIASVERYVGNLKSALVCDPDNLNAFSLLEKYKIMNGRIDEARADIAERAGRCAKDDPLCHAVCGFVDSLGAMLSSKNR